MKRFRVAPEASAERDDALDHYEEIQPELADDLLGEVTAAIRRACECPKAGVPARNGLRKVRTNRFPCAIYYFEEEREIVVWAVADPARDPGYWSKRRSR